MSHFHRPFGVILLLSVAVLTCADAPRPEPPPSIAFVGSAAEAEDPGFARFRAALNRAWPAGAPRPVLVYRRNSLEGDEHLAQAIRSALEERPRVLVVQTGHAARIASGMRRDTTSLVFASFLDPVRYHVVETMRQPGQGTTGVSLFDELHFKRLELLKDAFPGIRTVAVLADSDWYTFEVDLALLRTHAKQRLGLDLVAHVANSVDALDQLVNSAQTQTADGWYVPPTYISYLAESQIIAALRRLQRPAIHTTTQEMAAGALMAYSPDTSFTFDAMAELTRRVALGEDAGSIPVQRPYRYTLSVRIEPDAPWARIEPSVVRRADRVHRP
jgi:putative tryptophan/tyrosine transport system substrate-binding protein